MKKKSHIMKLTRVIFGFLLFLLMYVFVFEISGSIPGEYNIRQGEEYIIDTQFPMSIAYKGVKDEKSTIIEIDKLNKSLLSLANINDQIKLTSLEKGSIELKYHILGFIPYKTLKVNVVPKIFLQPGGHSIGVRLNTEGVLIVGVAEITDIEGKKHNLAEVGGIRIGDSLLEIDGKPINNKYHIIELLQEGKGKTISLTLLRDGKRFNTEITPVKSGEDESYKLGLWVRDKTAGVGTLTFFHEETKKFGALGHAITDIETGSILSVKDGDIIRSKVVSIQQGKKGSPGEIRGLFYDVDLPIGKLQHNTAHGIYGEVEKEFLEKVDDGPLEMAFQHEIKEGPATILTTLDDNKIEEYSIEIVKVNSQAKASIKSMVIKVTDKRLLEVTGGIVQGMSGSPIIQEDKIVGAVTHVLVNDPTKGYGIFIQWMVEESGIFDKYQ
ncbi:SpoIVB peptidase [Alkaliphilus serpentinus]|nr:SpoIVB peptidase [Alkaliphilus serpentinus]